MSILQVIIYDRLLGVRRTIGRFKDKAYGGIFRADGKLLAAGGEDGIVQVSLKLSITLNWRSH